jgi:cation transport regulator ChaC
MPLVFQYGSNVMRGRINGPSRLNGHAEDRGAACTVDDYDIAFDVWSQTNGCAAADLIHAPGRKAWGVLYEMADEYVRKLRVIEGKRYKETTIRVRNGEHQEVDAVTFVVCDTERRAGIATSAAYVSWIVYGLRDHGVPEDYVAHVVAIAIQTNARASNGATEQIRLMKTL